MIVNLVETCNGIINFQIGYGHDMKIGCWLEIVLIRPIENGAQSLLLDKQIQMHIHH